MYLTMLLHLHYILNMIWNRTTRGLLRRRRWFPDIFMADLLDFLYFSFIEIWSTWFLTIFSLWRFSNKQSFVEDLWRIFVITTATVYYLCFGSVSGPKSFICLTHFGFLIFDLKSPKIIVMFLDFIECNTDYFVIEWL